MKFAPICLLRPAPAEGRWGSFSRALLPRIGVLLLVALLPLSAAKIKLFLKAGGDLIVSEYEVLEDRVRYYSVERSAWEEIPLELVDLERTRQVVEEAEKARQERAAEDRIESAAERKARTELHNVPIEDGVYYLDGDQIVSVQQAEIKESGSKKRTFLQVIAPIPVVAGKTTMELEGASSAFTVNQARPFFYMRLEKISRFGIARLKGKKKDRIVQVIQTVPKASEMFEEQEEVEIFRQQLAPGVYKIWPIAPLPAGEYALFEYTPGQGDIRAWDFSCQPASSGLAATGEPSPGAAAEGGKRP